MSKKKTKGGKAAAAGKATEPKVSQAKLDALRQPVEEAKSGLEKAQADGKTMADKARALVGEAKDAYRTALAPYRKVPAPRRAFLSWGDLRLLTGTSRNGH